MRSNLCVAPWCTAAAGNMYAHECLAAWISGLLASRLWRRNYLPLLTDPEQDFQSTAHRQTHTLKQGNAEKGIDRQRHTTMHRRRDLFDRRTGLEWRRQRSREGESSWPLSSMTMPWIRRRRTHMLRLRSPRTPTATTTTTTTPPPPCHRHCHKHHHSALPYNFTIMTMCVHIYTNYTYIIIPWTRYATKRTQLHRECHVYIYVCRYKYYIYKTLILKLCDNKLQ